MLMLKKTTRGIALLFIAVSCQKQTPMHNEAIAGEIRAIEEAYTKAINSNDLEAALAYYADDAQSYSPDKKPLIGKAAIRKYLEEGMQVTQHGTVIQYKTREVLPSCDDGQVVELGSFEVTDSTGAKIAGGNYMSVFEKRNGKYYCIRDMAARDAPRGQ